MVLETVLAQTSCALDHRAYVLLLFSVVSCLSKWCSPSVVPRTTREATANVTWVLTLLAAGLHDGVVKSGWVNEPVHLNER